MSWLRLDDGFAEHPKVAALTDADYRRWVETLLYCARRREDGVVTTAVFDRVLGWDDAERLLELGLLDVHALEGEKVTSYRVHDWHVYNGARSDAERKRTERARKYGDDYYGLPVDNSGLPVDNSHGGLRGEYGSNPHGSVKSRDSHGTVTGDAADAVVSIARGRSPTPRDTYPSKDLPGAREAPERITALDVAGAYDAEPELHDAGGLTEAQVAQAREQRARSGYVDNLSSYTGCRYVRGTHGATALYDVLGTEPVPVGWEHPRPTRAEIAAALRSVEARA